MLLAGGRRNDHGPGETESTARWSRHSGATRSVEPGIHNYRL